MPFSEKLGHDITAFYYKTVGSLKRIAATAIRIDDQSHLVAIHQLEFAVTIPTSYFLSNPRPLHIPASFDYFHSEPPFET